MAEIYDLVVIGGGSAGLTAVSFAVESGARVALIESNRIGGDCTWSGCVPSKTLLKAAKVAQQMRTAERYGVGAAVPEVDLASVMTHVQSVVAETYREETPDVLRARGIDVYLGSPRFGDPHTIAVGEETLRARNVVLATGAHPFVPPINGLAGVDYVTYETLWDLRVLPRHLMVIGAGPIGCEMSQAFRRLGSRVTVIEGGERVLARDEPEASTTLAQVFEKEGIEFLFRSPAERVWKDQAGVHVLAGGEELVGDTLLVSVGRRPNVDDLDLENAGIAYGPRGIEVDAHLCTSSPHIYAAGDCTGSYQFTHYAGWQAIIAARNALLPGHTRGVREWVPWTTFTSPEVAHAGITEAQARERFGDDVTTTTWPMSQVDRARTDVDTSGFIKLVHKRNGKLLGVTILSERAGELIQEWMFVLDGRIKLRDLTTTIHVYPNYSRANVKAAGALLQKRYLEGNTGEIVRRLGRLMVRFMRWRRGF